MTSQPTVLLIATMDTKGEEALYIRSCLEEAGVKALIVDGGIRGESPVEAEVPRREVARAGGMELDEVRQVGHEGKAMNVMVQGAVALVRKIFEQGAVNGVIALGGSMGTTLGSGVMRALPVGFPKMMISTMASRDTRAFVGTKDICMLHSVVDLVGLNRITRRVLRNGALAMAGMVSRPPSDMRSDRPLVALSTLGTTEAAAQRVRKALEKDGNEVVIFHTVGSGGRAMEELIDEGEVDAVVDLSLHEVADNTFGGDYDAGPDRGRAALGRGLPTVLVPGNIDFLVTGPLEVAKKRFPDRVYHQHNAAITVIKSTAGELDDLAGIIAGRCAEAAGPLKVLVPTVGLSAFNSPGAPFFDPEATPAFTKSFTKALDEVDYSLLDLHVNDDAFADAVVAALKDVRAA